MFALGCDPDGISGAILPPITLSTTFVQSFPGVKPGVDDLNSHGTGYFYSRQANPTRGALERALAELDNGKHCCVFSSGLAATHAVMTLLKSGKDSLVASDLPLIVPRFRRQCRRHERLVRRNCGPIPRYYC